MVHHLSRGELPDENRLRGWFRAALTKKLAVVSLPAAFWENDPKRNPDSLRLLWASVLLHDLDGFRTVQAIMATEKIEQHLDQSVDNRIKDGLDSLVYMVSGSGVENEINAGIVFLQNK